VLQRQDIFKKMDDGWMWERNARPSGMNESGTIVQLRNKRRYTACSFSPKGDHVVAVDERGTIYLMKLFAGHHSILNRNKLAGQRGLQVTFSPTLPREFCVSSQDHSVSVCSTDDEDRVHRLTGHNHDIVSLSYHPSWSILVTASTDKLIVWETNMWVKKKTLGGGKGIVQATFSPRGDLILVAFKDGTIVGWGAHSYEVLLMLNAAVPEKYPNPAISKSEGSSSISCFAVSPNSQFLVGGTKGSVLFVWELVAKSLIRVIELPTGTAVCEQIEFLMDNISVAVLTDDGAIRLIHVLGSGNAQVFATIQNARSSFLSFSLSPLDSMLLAGCSSDGSWSLHSIDALQAYHDKINQMGASRLSEGMLTSYSVFLPQVNIDKIPAKVVSNVAEKKEAEIPQDDRIPTKVFSNIVKKEVKEQSRSEQAEAFSSVPPLVRLAKNLKKDRVAFNRVQLQKMLKFFGEFPEKYRVLVWRFLLELPENNTAYVALVNRGRHSNWNNLFEKFPIHSQRVFLRFERIIFALAHWSPLFTQVSYLPALIFPFVKLFGMDEMSSLETVMTILLSLCNEWFESYPHAPVFVLSRIESSLTEMDPMLLAHLEKHHITAQEYAWPMLRSMFSEVLSTDEWLAFWDHVIFYIKEMPRVLEYASLAYLQYHRVAIMSLSRKSDLESFFRRENPMQIKRWIKNVIRLSVNHPSHPSTVTLPRGLTYPAFTYYPKFVVDFEAQERKRIEMEDQHLEYERVNVQSIMEKASLLEKKEKEYIEQQQRMLLADEELRERFSEKEMCRLKEMERLSILSRERRLAHINKMENLASESLDLQNQLRKAEIDRVEQDISRQQKRREMELNLLKENDKVEQLELDSTSKLRELHANRALDCEMLNVRLESSTMAKEAELRWQAQRQSGLRAEEQRKIDRELDLHKKQMESRMKEIEYTRKKLHDTFALDQIKTQTQLESLEGEKQLRDFSEVTRLKQGEELEAQMKRLREQKTDANQILVSEMNDWKKNAEGERTKILNEERKRLDEESQQIQSSIVALEAEQETREFQEKVSHAFRETRRDMEQQESQLQDQLMQLEKQRKAESLLLTSIHTQEKQLEARMNIINQSKMNEDAAIKAERQRFSQLRVELEKQNM